VITATDAIKAKYIFDLQLVFSGDENICPAPAKREMLHQSPDYSHLA
jgi:hypothetical protein